MWFDGTGLGANAESGTASQTMTIPPGSTATLTFYLWVIGVNAPANSVLTVTVDGTVAMTINEPAAAESGYALRTVDLSAFANGAPRQISFNYVRPGGAAGSDNFIIDDVALNATPGQAFATINGRVTSPSGQSVRNAVVTLTDSQGVRRMATTSSFGIYSFTNVGTGPGYVLGVSTKRYRFSARSLTINSNMTAVDFVGLE